MLAVYVRHALMAAVLLMCCHVHFSCALSSPGDFSSSSSSFAPPLALSSVVRGVWIVVFRSYAHHAEHERTLSSLLEDGAAVNSSDPSWSVQRRYNPASCHPTDFLLVRTTDTADGEQTEQALASLSSAEPLIVKSVSRERQYRHLLGVSSSRSPPPNDTPPASVDPPPHYTRDPYTEFDVDPLNVGSFALPRRFSSAAALSQQYPDFTAQYASYAADGQYNVTPPTSSVQSVTPSRFHHRRLLSTGGGGASVSRRYLADVLWNKGHTGADIRIAIFDTGLSATHPHFKYIRERSNWTDNDSLDDELGHGTHVAGIIASHYSECLGFAPDAELYVFRVFNSRQLSFTSWFLDAFNYAIASKVDVLNLSIGGPDFNDRPFVDKVLELSANRIIVVSAIGNDGPLYGTLNNPADQMDTIGVGGLNADDTLAYFSSRGMTTWELPSGYGRVKPDVVAFANGVVGSKIHNGCKAQTGTSVASPVVAGAVVLLASSIPSHLRATQLNSARLKQALTEGAKRVPAANIFEQGTGKLDLLAAFDHLNEKQPHVSAIPASLDLTDCPYMWPYCSQELYYSAQPIIVNVTLLNSISVASRIVRQPYWQPASPSSALSLRFSYSEPLWPWSGYLAIELRVEEDVTEKQIVEGTIALSVESDDGSVSTLSIPLRASVIPRPPRQRRLLWDQFHNLRYPSGYFPRDNLEVKTDTLDWNGDHPHTNFKQLYTQLRQMGYYVEVLGGNFMCFDAQLYGALLLVDPEEEYFSVEVSKLHSDVVERGLSLIVVAEWYNLQVMREVKFWDENTASWWTPETGGSNVPALNELMAPFGIAFSHHVVKGRVNVTNQLIAFNSGTTIARFPAAGRLLFSPLADAGSGSPARAYPVLGLLPPSNASSGRVAVWGDSNCLDLNNNHGGYCAHLLEQLVTFASPNPSMSVEPSALVQHTDLQAAAFSDPTVPELPTRMVGNNMHKYSRVLGPHASPVCRSPFDVKPTRRQRPVATNMLRPDGNEAAINAHFYTALPSSTFSAHDSSGLVASAREVDRSDGSSGGGIAGGEMSYRGFHHRHNFRTAFTSFLLVSFLLLCLVLPLSTLALLHLYGNDADKRSEEQQDERRRPAAASMGRTLWLWTARTAPTGLIALLRLVHAQLLPPHPPTPTSSSSMASPQASLSRAPSLTSFQRSTSGYALRVDDRDSERVIVA